MRKSEATELENHTGSIGSQMQLSIYIVPKKNHSEMLKLVNEFYDMIEKIHHTHGNLSAR